MISNKENLIDIINIFGISRGEPFTLSSGQTSDIYINIKKISLHNKVHKLLASLLCEEINKYSPIEAVAGVVLGGCHLASITAMYSAIPLDVIYIRKELKEYGTKNLIECSYSHMDSKVVLLEDVTTTGASALKAANLLNESGFIVNGIVSVVDRRADKQPFIGNYPFSSLINFEELSI